VKSGGKGCSERRVVRHWRKKRRYLWMKKKRRDGCIGGGEKRWREKDKNKWVF